MAKEALIKGDILRVEGPCEIRIRVYTGLVWGTSSPADGDSIFRSGDQGQFVSSGTVILEALSDAELEWSKPGGCS